MPAPRTSPLTNWGAAGESGARSTCATLDAPAVAARVFLGGRQRLRLCQPVPASGGPGALSRCPRLRTLPPAMVGGKDSHGRSAARNAREPLLLPAALGWCDQAPQ